MIDVYCDESHDENTYALGGWLATPSGWDAFCPRWRAMLDELETPSGLRLPAFHASEIVNRAIISDCTVKGWTFEDEKHAFSRAIDVIEDRSLCANLFAVGCAIALPSNVRWGGTKDSFWYLLFTRFFAMLVERFPAFNGFNLVFDEKPAVKSVVDDFYESELALSKSVWPGRYAGQKITFADDATTEPLQAADLLVYEWRRRLSDAVTRPDKPPRRSYTRLRAVCASYSELHYLPEDAVRRALQDASGDAASLARTLLTCPAIRT
jgi:hypothetical protein